MPTPSMPTHPGNIPIYPLLRPVSYSAGSSYRFNAGHSLRCRSDSRTCGRLDGVLGVFPRCLPEVNKPITRATRRILTRVYARPPGNVLAFLCCCRRFSGFRVSVRREDSESGPISLPGKFKSRRRKKGKSEGEKQDENPPSCTLNLRRPV